MGYLEAQSHKLCDVEMCPISSPRLNEALAALRGMLYDRRWPRFIRSLMVFTNERQVQMKVLESSRAGGAAIFRLVRRSDSRAGSRELSTTPPRGSTTVSAATRFSR